MIYRFLKSVLFTFSIFLISPIASQTLCSGDNTFIYQSNINPKEIILQHVLKNGDTLIVSSTRIEVNDTNLDVLFYKYKDLKELIFEEDTNANFKQDSFYFHDTLILNKNRKKYKPSYTIQSLITGYFYVSFSGEAIDSRFNVPIDGYSDILYLIRTNSDTTVGLFYRGSGFMGFQDYCYKKDFWMLYYISYDNRRNYFNLIYYNNEKVTSVIKLE